MLIITIITELMIGSRKDLAWSWICYKEKETFSWQAWLRSATQHSSSHSPPATLPAGPLVSFTIPALMLPLQNSWYLGSSLRFNKRTGINIYGEGGWFMSVFSLSLFFFFFIISYTRERRQHWVGEWAGVEPTWQREGAKEHTLG